MTHEMKLNPVAFEMIKSGQKRIEVRLLDEKRKLIKVGDEVVFLKLPEMTDKLSARVIDLYKYNNFRTLYSKFPAKDFGGEGWSVDELVENIYQYYSIQEEKLYGVVGIKLSLI